MAKLVAKETFHVALKSGRRSVQAGDIVEDSDPVVKAVPGMFQPVEDWLEAEAARKVTAVEAATAVPGESRTVKKTAARKTKKK